MGVKEFSEDRRRMNDLLLSTAGTVTKRFFSLDNQTYREGALDKKTKELLGLVASLVLRCDDCITYHIVECFRQGLTFEEFDEACSVALVVGGSIVIPHLRRARVRWDELEKQGVPAE